MESFQVYEIALPKIGLRYGIESGGDYEICAVFWQKYRVVQRQPDISEEHIASVFRVVE